MKLRWETQGRFCYGTVTGDDEPAYTCELDAEDYIWRAEGPGGVDLGFGGELVDVQSYCQTHHTKKLRALEKLRELEQKLSDEVGVEGCRIVVKEMCGGWTASRASLYDVAGRRWVVAGGLARKDAKHGWIPYDQLPGGRFTPYKDDLLDLLDSAMVHGDDEWAALTS